MEMATETETEMEMEMDMATETVMETDQTEGKLLMSVKGKYSLAGYTKLYRKIPWDVYRGMELP